VTTSRLANPYYHSIKLTNSLKLYLSLSDVPRQTGTEEFETRKVSRGNGSGDIIVAIKCSLTLPLVYRLLLVGIRLNPEYIRLVSQWLG
jgi:hypothetical protein